ncbi:hypothetical protein RI129_007786 [Pyrocoelia pectoralis]|uniref:Ionotropic glutamate receptor C-terminal domain-containing protein n=1 Tax=Pyrocoelia pectoralis TaxID=417401 RepID=A0AAN7ZN42_9COLE
MGKCFHCNKRVNISTFLLDYPLNGLNFGTPLITSSPVPPVELEKELRDKHFTIGTLQVKYADMCLFLFNFILKNGVLSNAYRQNGSWYGGGVAFQIINQLQKIYGFQYSVVLPTENHLESKEGLFGLIHDEYVDLGAAFLPVTATYSKYANFSTILDMGQWVAVYKRPEELESDGLGLLAPFTTNLWFSILFCMMLVGCTLYIILWIFKKFCSKCKGRSLMECLWFVYGALLKQGYTITPKTDSARIVFASWWMFVMLVTTFYTANLTAYLTVAELPLPIKTISDISLKKCTLIIKAESVIEELITNDLEKLYAIYKNSQKIFVNDEDEDILSNWISNKHVHHHVFIAEQPNIDVVLHQNYLTQTRCPYITLSPVYTLPRAFAYSKSFKFGSLFDKAIRNLVEVGLVEHFIKAYLPESNSCPLNLRRTERQLNNSHLSMAYYLMITGFLLAFIIFTTEIATKIFKRRKIRSLKKEANSAVNLPSSQFMNVLLSPCIDHFPNLKKKLINGRLYWVSNIKGELRLIPIRAASTLIFHKRVKRTQ